MAFVPPAPFWVRPNQDLFYAATSARMAEFIESLEADVVTAAFVSLPVWTFASNFSLEQFTLYRMEDGTTSISFSDGPRHGSWRLELNYQRGDPAEGLRLRSRQFELIVGTSTFVKRPDASGDGVEWSHFLIPLIDQTPTLATPRLLGEGEVLDAPWEGEAWIIDPTMAPRWTSSAPDVGSPTVSTSPTSFERAALVAGSSFEGDPSGAHEAGSPAASTSPASFELEALGAGAAQDAEPSSLEPIGNASRPSGDGDDEPSDRTVDEDAPLGWYDRLVLPVGGGVSEDIEGECDPSE